MSLTHDDVVLAKIEFLTQQFEKNSEFLVSLNEEFHLTPEEKENILDFMTEKTLEDFELFTSVCEVILKTR